MANYNSKYTGNQVDDAVGDKTEAGSLQYIQSLPQTTGGQLSPTKLFICTDSGSYANTLWRYSNGTMVQIAGSGGGGGGGTSVYPITDPGDQRIISKSKLAGLGIGTDIFKVSYVSIEQNGSEYKLFIN